MSVKNPRNGCNPELAKEEFQAMKMMIYTSFKDKSYLGLWEVMLTTEPYCSDYKASGFVFSRLHTHT